MIGLFLSQIQHFELLDLKILNGLKFSVSEKNYTIFAKFNVNYQTYDIDLHPKNEKSIRKCSWQRQLLTNQWTDRQTQWRRQYTPTFFCGRMKTIWFVSGNFLKISLKQRERNLMYLYIYKDSHADVWKYAHIALDPPAHSTPAITASERLSKDATPKLAKPRLPAHLLLE